MQNLVLQSKKHIEFLAANAPEIRTNLESVAEVCRRLPICWKIKSCLTVIHASSLRKSAPAKNQAYDFIATEKLIGRFKTFCECYPQTCTSV
jgi:hypothetical protein